MNKIVFLISLIALTACSASSNVRRPAVDEAKVRLTISEEIDYLTMIGSWVGESPTKSGGVYRWFVRRCPDGTFEATFRQQTADGRVEESKELGLWGISGPIYFTITQGWIEGDQLIPTDPANPYFYDAYKVIALEGDYFEYESLSTGNQYAVRRVADDYSDRDW